MKHLTGYERVPDHLLKYVDYIKKTGKNSISKEVFDDDWSPIGPLIRNELMKDGFIYNGDGKSLAILEGICLRPDLI